MKQIILTVAFSLHIGFLFAQKDTIKYDSGNVFIGNAKTYRGTLFSSDGSVYKGLIIDGKATGIATYYAENGDKKGVKYHGEFNDGVFHGKGRLDCQDKVILSDFVEGNTCGVGIIFYSNGDLYTGEILNGRPHGHGKKYYKHLYVEGNYNKGRLMDGYAYNSLMGKPNRFQNEELWIPSRHPHRLIENGKVLQNSYAYPRITDPERKRQYSILMSELKPFPGEKLTKAEIKFSKQISRR